MHHRIRMRITPAGGAAVEGVVLDTRGRPVGGDAAGVERAAEEAMRVVRAAAALATEAAELGVDDVRRPSLRVFQPRPWHALVDDDGARVEVDLRGARVDLAPGAGGDPFGPVFDLAHDVATVDDAEPAR